MRPLLKTGIWRYAAIMIRTQLAQAYRILAHLGMDDHTYTHLSARASDGISYYIYPFGLRFEEVTPECLLHVSLDGQILDGVEAHYNRTGFMIHGAIYQARPDLNAIFHVHTPEMVAVSALREGLLSISQWALHFYERVAYHAYDSLVLDQAQAPRLIQDLGDKSVMLMRHHGAVTAGKTLHEALFYLYHLQQACKTQCLTLAQGREVVQIPAAMCQKAVADLLTFEEDLGRRDWDAWVRCITS